jgi:hypothetical protein
MTTYLQPNTNTSPQERSLQHTLDSQVNYSLSQQDETSHVANSIRNLRHSRNFRLAFLHQPPHIHLSLSRVMELGRDVGVRSNSLLGSKNCFQRFYV